MSISPSTASMSSSPSDALLFADTADEEPEQPFLWEQISSSIDAVELEEVQRVVGMSLVSACTDIYAELRALRDIHSEYAAGTDEIVNSRASLPRAMSSAPAGLVQLELKSLVGQLRQRARETGVPEDALLPTPDSPHRAPLFLDRPPFRLAAFKTSVQIDKSGHHTAAGLALESVLNGDGGGASGAPGRSRTQTFVRCGFRIFVQLYFSQRANATP